MRPPWDRVGRVSYGPVNPPTTPGAQRTYNLAIMAPPKRKVDGFKEAYDRIRKPTAPPTKVEKDRRKKLIERAAKREERASLKEGDS